MSNIPEYKTGGVADVASINAQEGRIEQQGFNAIARGAQSIGQAAMSLQQIEIAKRDRVERHDAVTKNIELKQYVRENEKVLREQFAKNPNDPQVFESYKKDVQNIIDEQSAGFKNAGIKKSFQNMSKDLLFRGEESLKQWQTAQTKENILLDNQKSLEVINQGALENPNLNNALDSLKELDLLKLTNADTLGQNFADANNIKQAMETAGNFIEANLVNGDIGQAKSMIKDQRIIDALGTKGILRARKQIKNAEDAQRRKAESIKSLKFSNSWKYLDAIGETKNLVPLSFGDPGSFIKRQNFLEDMTEKHPGINLDSVPIHPAEAKSLENFVIGSNDRDLNTMLSQIDMTVDDRMKQSFGSQLFPKAPALGAAINLAGEDPESSLRILRGFRQVQANNLEISQSGIKTEIDSQLLNYIDDNGQRGLMKEAVLAHVVDSVFSTGGSLKDIPADIVTDSINSVLGPMFQGEDGYFSDDSFISDSKIVSFRGVNGQFIEKEEFEETFDSLTPENINQFMTEKPIDSNGEVVDLAKYSSSFKIKTIGDGVYELLSKQNGLPLSNQNGQEFQLNLKEFYLNKNKGE